MRMRQLVPGKGFCLYLMYTLTLLVFLLWFRFPADALRSRVATDLNRMTPELKWDIGAIGLSFPMDIRFSDIRVESGDKGDRKVVLLMESFNLRPNFTDWQKNGTWSANYHLKMLKGNVTGAFNLAENNTLLPYSAEVQGLSLDSPGLKKILQKYDRTASGLLSGNFTGTWDIQKTASADLAGTVRLDKGTISLQKPVLSMQQLAFEQMSGKVKYHAGVLDINDGRMESRQLSAKFSGTLRFHASILPLSRLQLKGSLIPRPEFMASIGDAKIGNLLKRQLREGRLPFNIKGSLKSPGVSFNGFSADVNKQLRKRSR